MGSQGPKSSKPSKPTSQITSPPSRSSSSSLSSHLAMVELKQRILNSLSKLADRDTHQIAVEDLEKIIQTLSNDGVPMLLNCLYDASNDPKTAVKKESLRLLSVLCSSHGDSAATHLPKIIAHIVKRLKDSDSGVRDACRDVIGSLSSQYLKGEAEGGGLGSVVSLFVKPLFEAMSENNKTVQTGAAICMAKMVECASEPPIIAFQKLCPRICKYLNSPNFMAKASLLGVVSSLSQVGAIAPQNLTTLLHSIHDCLASSDWTTRKAAADTLIALALHSRNLISEGASSVIATLEGCRFDKIKPVRDSMLDALQHWKNIAGEGAVVPDNQKALSHDGGTPEPADTSDMKEPSHSHEREETLLSNSTSEASAADSSSKSKGSNILDKAVGILRKKASTLSDKGLNPDFFQKLETRGSGDFPVEVVVPRRHLNSSQKEEESEANDNCPSNRITRKYQKDDGFSGYSNRDMRSTFSAANIARDSDDYDASNPRGSSRFHEAFTKTSATEEEIMSSKGNWLAIQRQLFHLERQQSHLMNMLNEFMGGSHDTMVTLENRVRGLERVVEDMARDLSISAGRRSTNYTVGFEGSSSRSTTKYNGFPDYSAAKLSRDGDGRVPFGERYMPPDGISSGMRGRTPSWRSDASEGWDFHTVGKNGQMNSKRTTSSGPVDCRSPKSENETDQGGSRRAWDKGSGPLRLGEGPSARSVWQASKDEATLEAIRVAGEDNGAARSARVAIPELTAEALGEDDNLLQERDPVWTSWRNAMDALHVGDMESAYAEVLSTGDDPLLVKLMERTGPVVDQLSTETASEVLHAVSQFLPEQNLSDICLSWVQQVADIVAESGHDILRIPVEVKKQLLFNLNEASSLIDLPEDWEGATPDQLLLQLASSWEVDLHKLGK